MNRARPDRLHLTMATLLLPSTSLHFNVRKRKRGEQRIEIFTTFHAYLSAADGFPLLAFLSPSLPLDTFHFFFFFFFVLLLGRELLETRRRLVRFFSFSLKFALLETNVDGFAGFFFSFVLRNREGREIRGSWIADRRRLCSTEYSERVRTRRVLVERLRLSLRNDPLLLAGLKLHLPTTRLLYDSSPTYIRLGVRGANRERAQVSLWTMISRPWVGHD